MKEEKNLEQLEILQEETNKLRKGPPSTHLAQYLQQFNYKDLCQYQKEKTLVLQTLKEREDFRIKQSLDSDFSLKIMAHSPNKEFVEIQATLGSFTLNNIIVAIFETQSRTHNVSESYSGSFCTTFRAKCYGKYSAFKCFSLLQKTQGTSNNFLKETDQRQKRIVAIRDAIKEYCITLIASELKIGPKMEKRMGYDIAIYRNCLEFDMEFCLQQKEIPDEVNYEEQAKVALKTAHFFRLIHYDIKPENICFSPKQDRLVFIDFGFSEFSSVELGEMQMMSFKGSFFYASKQMVSIFNEQSTGEVDPYFNDLFCLRKSIEKYQDNKLKKKMQRNTQIFKGQKKYNCIEYFKVDDISDFHVVKKMKFLLLQLRKKQFLELWSNKKYQKIVRLSRRVFLEFMFSLKYTQQFSQFQSLFEDNDQIQQSLSVQNSLLKLNFYNRLSKRENSIEQSIADIFQDLIDAASFKFNHKQYQRNFKDETEYLLKFHTIDTSKLYQEEYFLCLAKALQINTNKCSFVLKKQFASAALLSSLFENSLPQNSSLNLQLQAGIEKNDFSCLKLVSRNLFEYSISQPHSNVKFEIYAACLLNLIVLKAVSQDQLFEYYVRIHSLKVNFQIKLRMVLKFVTSYNWMIYTIKSKQNYFNHIQRYKQFSSVFLGELKKSGYKNWQTYLYWLFTQISQNNLYQLLIKQQPQMDQINQTYLDNQTAIKSLDFKSQILRWKQYISTAVFRLDYSSTYYYASLMRKSILDTEKEFDYYFFAGLLSQDLQNVSYKLSMFFKSIISQSSIQLEYCVSNLLEIISYLNVPQDQFKNSLPNLIQRIPQYEHLNFTYYTYLSYFQNRVECQQFKANYFFVLNLLHKRSLSSNFTNIEHFYSQKINNCIFTDKHPYFQKGQCYLQLFTPQVQKQTLNFMIPTYRAQKKFQQKHLKQIKTIDNIFLTQLSLNQIISILLLKNTKQSKEKVSQLSSIIMRVVYLLRKSILSKIYKKTFLSFQDAIDRSTSHEQFKIDQNHIYLYNLFLENESSLFQFLFMKGLLFKFLVLIQKYQGIQKMVEFYRIYIQKYFQKKARFQSRHQLLSLIIKLIQTIKENPESKRKLLQIVQKQMHKDYNLFLLVLPIINQLKVPSSPLNYFRTFKGIKTYPVSIRVFCLWILFDLSMAGFTRKCPLRKRRALAKRKVKCELNENIPLSWPIKILYAPISQFKYPPPHLLKYKIEKLQVIKNPIQRAFSHWRSYYLK